MGELEGKFVVEGEGLGNGERAARGSGGGGASELEKFRALGQNPVEILNRSIMNGWTGVFELKNDSRTPDSLTDHNQRLGERWLSKEA